MANLPSSEIAIPFHALLSLKNGFAILSRNLSVAFTCGSYFDLLKPFKVYFLCPRITFQFQEPTSCTESFLGHSLGPFDSAGPILSDSLEMEGLWTKAEGFMSP